MNGDGARRSDPLFKIGHTESTQASDLQAGLTSRTGMPSARGTFFLSTNKYKPMMEEIVQEKEILESSVDPQEWKKECDRVGPLLVVKLKNALASTTTFEQEAQERAYRRKKTLQHLRVVSEFRESNIPLLMESVCEHWREQLQRIRTQEEKLTQ